MRLIDAETLKKRIIHESIREGAYGYLDAKTLISIIDREPTIDRVSVTLDEEKVARTLEHRRKHEARNRGEWRKLRDASSGQEFCYCSACETIRTEMTKFCPDCGARMVQEGEEP